MGVVFVVIIVKFRTVCVVIYHLVEKGVTVYHDACLKQGFYLFMNST